MNTTGYSNKIVNCAAVICAYKAVCQQSPPQNVVKHFELLQSAI